MLQAFAITFRETLEALLIVAISLAFLRKSRRRPLVTAVQLGIAVSIVMSVFAAWWYSSAENQPAWDGALALGAAFAVAAFGVHVWRTGRRLESHIDAEEQVAMSSGPAAWVAMFAFAVLMIVRQGMGIMLLMGALIFQVRAPQLVGGAVLGIVAAATVAAAWSRMGHRIHQRAFFQATTVFLFVFVAHLLFDGFHELAEASLFAQSDVWLARTEAFSAEGTYGQYASYLLIAAPLAWLSIALLRRERTVTRTA